jgi:hypothetical protein
MPFAFVGFYWAGKTILLVALPAALFPYSSLKRERRQTMKAVNRNTPLL